MARWSLLAIVLAGCGGSRAPVPSSATSELGAEVVFDGMCDASGAVALSARTMVAADDEDNVLRVYDPDVGGPPSSSADVSQGLGVPWKGKKNPRPAEVDLEAATLLDDRAYWISSHGRNKKGSFKEERLRFFATTISADGAAIEVIGSYDGLLQDLVADPRYAGFELARAAELPPKEPGGLNIEGLTATPDGRLFIGFRNPVPDGVALIAPLEDPAALVATDPAPARFGDPIRLDLGGLGVRSLSWWRDRYLVIGGAAGDGGASRLFTWDGVGAAIPVAIDLSAYNPEGFFSPEDREEVLLLSDDGTVLVEGVPCKELDDPARRRFRGVWIRP